MTLQLLELTSRGFAIVYRFRHADRSANRQEHSSALNIGRNCNALPRFAVSSIRFFIVFFLVVIFFFSFMPMPLLTFIAVQTVTAAALSLRVESLVVARPSALSTSTLSAACLSVRSLLRGYAMSCSRHAASSRFMSLLPLANRFVSQVPGPLN